MSLKAYDGDVADLGLDFTVVCDALGVTKVTEHRLNVACLLKNAPTKTSRTAFHSRLKN